MHLNNASPLVFGVLNLQQFHYTVMYSYYSPHNIFSILKKIKQKRVKTDSYRRFNTLKTLYPKMISTGIMIHSLMTRINNNNVNGIPYITCNQ